MTSSKITWRCHICNAERPDEKISVLTKPLGVTDAVQNIRYCNDNPRCIEGAKQFSFVKEANA